MRILIFLIGLFISFAAIAQDRPETLAPDERLEGQFVQKRYLKGFDHPLTSSGVFSFAQDMGLIWKTLTPFETQLNLNKDGMVQTVDGQEAMNVPVSRFPALKMLHDVMAQSLQGDWAVLEEKYGAQRVATSNGWAMEFIPPGDAPFKKLHMSGSAFLEKLIIDKPQEDRDEIFFTDQVIKKAD